MIKNAAIRGGSNRGLLLLALLLGLVSAVLIGVFLSQANSGGGGGTSGSTVPAVVASQDIPALTRISEGMITVKQVPKDAILPGVFDKTDAVVGQVTQVPLTAGEQVIANKVTATGAALQQFGGDVPLSFTIPERKRAFSIAVSETAAAGGMVRAGDFVDVLMSGSVEVPGQPNTSLIPASGCYVLQDVEVLAIAQHLKKPGTGADSSGISSSEADVKAISATLAVTPDQAWRLAAAQQGIDSGGQVTQPLWISLRPFGDRGEAGGIPVCDVKAGS